MSAIDSILLEIAQNSMRRLVIAEGDYTGEDGFLYCGKCNTPKQTSIEIGGQSVVVGCMCRCETEQREREEAARVRTALPQKSTSQLPLRRRIWS